MDKQHILAEINRTADANDGVPLGTSKFFQATGIKQSDWYGKYWSQWGNAVHEAGFTRNQMQGAYDEVFIIEKFIKLIQELGKFPTVGELRLKARNDVEFPSHTVFNRLGSKVQRASRIIEYCRGREGFADVIHASEQVARATRPATEDEAPTTEEFGFVYMLKSGGFFKIGRSNAAGRRERELAIQLPEKTNTVHVSRTDDPVGIEAYWHKRFEAKRKNGEWFELSSLDVKAFRRRKFM
jgi:hypothetical protein